ncbi:hypothetical protein GCK32_001003 [Trichostrongylus colubriformis]|uniref:Uncharacterized protein n=1 Tax=Trichostrongylus colubriformis TaxID=6319 RepID=A0AAN8IV78_TRICO
MILFELYRRIKQKLKIERRATDRAESKASRSQSTREFNSKISSCSSVVVRPRAGTEIVIERRRYSKSSPSSSELADRYCKSAKKNSSRSAPLSTESQRNRSDSAPLRPLSRIPRSDPAHLSLLSTGSILAPTYRSRALTMARPTFVRITVE